MFLGETIMKIIKHVLCLALLLPFQIIIAQSITQACEQDQNSNQFVYITQNVREILISFEEALPNCSWSPSFRALCKDIKNNAFTAEVNAAESVVQECLELFKGNTSPELDCIEQELKDYAHAIRTGDAQLKVTDANSTRASCCNTSCNNSCVKYKKTKAFCNLLAHDLQIDGSAYIANLTAGNLRVVGSTNFTGPVTFDVAPSIPETPVFTITTEENTVDIGSARIARIFFDVDQATGTSEGYEIDSTAITANSVIFFGNIYLTAENSNLVMNGVTILDGAVSFNLSNNGPDAITNGFYITLWVLN